MDADGSDAERFASHLLLPGLGPAGQARIRSARIHVVGAGAVAGPALLCLAQAGAGALFVDDGEDVAAADAATWLYGPDQAGQPRLLAALAALRGASSLVQARAHATGASATAALICAPGEAVARDAADRARRAGLPHVIALCDGGRGEVVTVPLGAPCFDCASRPAARLAPLPAAAAAVGTLAAVELLLVVARALPGNGAGRRIDLRDGLPRAEPTVRRPGCDCRNVY